MKNHHRIVQATDGKKICRNQKTTTSEKRELGSEIVGLFALLEVGGGEDFQRTVAYDRRKPVRSKNGSKRGDSWGAWKTNYSMMIGEVGVRKRKSNGKRR